MKKLECDPRIAIVHNQLMFFLLFRFFVDLLLMLDFFVTVTCCPVLRRHDSTAYGHHFSTEMGSTIVFGHDCNRMRKCDSLHLKTIKKI